MGGKVVAVLCCIVAASIIAADPHEHLKVNESTGTSAQDASGNNFHGALVGASQFDTGGRLRNCILNDGVSGYARLANDSTLNFANNEPFSISVWVKTTDAYGPIASFRNSNDDDSLIDICVGLNGVTNNPGQLVVIVRQDNGGGTPEVNGPIINDNAWHHVVLVRTATQMELFVDGTSRSTNNSSAALGALTFDERALGAELRWIAGNVNSADQRFLNGRIDDFRVYKRAISAAEALDLATPDTATALGVSPTPSTFGQSATLTATVTNTRTTPNAGAVTFFDGSTNLGTGNVNASGVATLNVSTLGGGAHSLSAVYGGESLWAASTSTAVAHTVNPAATTTTLTAPAATVFGQAAVFNVALVSAGGIPDGTVTLFEGTTALGSSSLVGGAASISASSLTAGVHTLHASYTASANFSASQSANLNFTVNAAPTQVNLLSSQNPARLGSAVTFTAQVVTLPPGVGTVTGGSMIFSVDGVATATAAVVNGSASTTLTLDGGDHALTALYQGAPNFAASVSSVLTQSLQIPPVADAQSIFVAQDRAKSFTLSGTDSGNLPLTYTLLSQPAHGTLSGTAPNLTYTPAVGYIGADAFAFSVFNGQQQSVPATVTLNTIAAPVFVSGPSVMPNPAIAGRPVVGNASVLAADGATPVWNWGDGSNDSDGSHVFAQPGIYTVTVSATGASTGLTTVQSITLHVSLGIEGSGGGTADTSGVYGILVGGAGAGSEAGGKGKIICNYVRRDKTTYTGALGTLSYPETLQQSDLIATTGILTLGVGAKAQQFYFTLDGKGRSKSTDLPKIELSLKKKSFEFKAKRAALADLTESLGGPREFQNDSREPVTLMVPATVEIGTKLFLAMTFQVSYQQINSKGGKGSLAP